MSSASASGPWYVSRRRPFSLLDSASAPETQSARKLRKQNSDQRTSKKLIDNFKGWTDDAIDVHTVDFKTLRQRISSDDKAMRNKEPDAPTTMGALYYKKLKELYKPPSDPSTQLAPDTANEAIDPRLLKAMVAAKRARPDKSFMHSFISSATAPNSTELCGILKFFLEQKPHCEKQLPLCMDIMRYCARNNIKGKFPAQANRVTFMFDKSLTCAYMVAKTDQMLPGTFVQLNSQILALVMDMIDLKLLTDADASVNWMSLAGPLTRLVSSSAIGTAMFGFALHNVIAQLIADKIDQILLELRDVGLTAAIIVETKRKMIIEIDALENIELLRPRREVNVKYRGASFAANVNSIAEEINIKVASLWKGLAVKQGVLDPLWCEDSTSGKHSVFSVVFWPSSSCTWR